MDTSKTAAPTEPGGRPDLIDAFLTTPGGEPIKPLGGPPELNSHWKKKRTSTNPGKKRNPKTLRTLNYTGPRETKTEENTKLYLSSASSDELLGHTLRLFYGHYPFTTFHYGKSKCKVTRRSF